MKRILFFGGLILLLAGCSNSGDGTGQTDTAAADKGVITNSGPASTGGVGAGFGSGGNTTSDSTAGSMDGTATDSDTNRNRQ